MLNVPEIDFFGITWWRGEVEIVWHLGFRQSRRFAAKHSDVRPDDG
jgi:hypothetical protein